MIRISLWTVIFLIALRVSIGWHFFFEGWHKLHTHEIGVTETNKPWTSEGYFRLSEGPTRNLLLNFIGDLDQEMLEKLHLAPVEEGKLEADLARLPKPLVQDWDAYLNKFVAYFNLDDDTRKLAEKKVEQEKGKLMEWFLKGEKEVKRPSPTGTPTIDVKISTPQRILEYDLKVRELRDIMERRLRSLGRDVEKKIPAIRGEINTARLEFKADLDGMKTKMQDALATLVQAKTSGFKLSGSEWAGAGDQLLAMLEPTRSEVKFGEEDSAMPKALGDQWDAYLAFVKEFNPSVKADQVDPKLARAKRSYVRYLLGRDEYSGEPLPSSDVARRLLALQGAMDKLKKIQADQAASKDQSPGKKAEVEAAQQEVTYLRTGFINDIQRHTDTMRAQVGESLSGELSKGYPPADKPKSNIRLMDDITMWALTIMGACVMFGFFTRIMCFLSAGFLLMTYLAHPAFPWLPTSPMNEGYYLFVNKNVIEFLALMMLATTRSGQWLGIDALISWIFTRRK